MKSNCSTRCNFDLTLSLFSHSSTLCILTSFQEAKLDHKFSFSSRGKLRLWSSEMPPWPPGTQVWGLRYSWLGVTSGVVIEMISDGFLQVIVTRQVSEMWPLLKSLKLSATQTVRGTLWGGNPIGGPRAKFRPISLSVGYNKVKKKWSGVEKFSRSGRLWYAHGHF